MNYTDELIESVLDESAKTDFIDKFGNNLFTTFIKAKQRLINNGYSADFGQYLKYTANELTDFLLSLYDDKKEAEKKRIISGTQREVRGKYNFLGEHGGYLVYQPLDYLASMDLGINTGWCTTGRYGHAGHPDFTPSEEDAKEHFEAYTKKEGVKLYYFLDPKTFYGEWAFAIYPNKIDLADIISGLKSRIAGDKLVKQVNFELYNYEDDFEYDWQIIKIAKEQAGLNLELECDQIELRDDFLVINKDTIISKNSIDKELIIPAWARMIECYAFENAQIEKLIFYNGVTKIMSGAFFANKLLRDVQLPNSLTYIGTGAFEGCAIANINLPKNLKHVGADAFCTRLVIPHIKINSYLDSYARHTWYSHKGIIMQIDSGFPENSEKQLAELGDFVANLASGCNKLLLPNYKVNCTNTKLFTDKFKIDFMDKDTGEVLNGKNITLTDLEMCSSDYNTISVYGKIIS